MVRRRRTRRRRKSEKELEEEWLNELLDEHGELEVGLMLQNEFGGGARIGFDAANDFDGGRGRERERRIMRREELFRREGQWDD